MLFQNRFRCADALPRDRKTCRRFRINNIIFLYHCIGGSRQISDAVGIMTLISFQRGWLSPLFQTLCGIVHQGGNCRMIGQHKSRKKIPVRLTSLPLVIGQYHHFSAAAADDFPIPQKIHGNHGIHGLRQLRQYLSVDHKTGIIYRYRFSLSGWNLRKPGLAGMKECKIRGNPQGKTINRQACIIENPDPAHRRNSILIQSIIKDIHLADIHSDILISIIISFSG